MLISDPRITFSQAKSVRYTGYEFFSSIRVRDMTIGIRVESDAASKKSYECTPISAREIR